MKIKRLISFFECFLCHSKFQSNTSNLRRHMKLRQIKVKCFTCLVCSKTYQNKSNFYKHWADKHHGSEPQFKESTRSSRGKAMMVNYFDLHKKV